MITFQARSQSTERAWASIYIHKIYRTCSNHHTSREDWMIYRGPGFLAVVWFGSTPTPFPTSRQQIVSLSVFRRSSLLTEGRGWAWSRSHVRKKAWHSINRAKLSASHTPFSPSLPLSLPKRIHHPYREYRLRRWIIFRQRTPKYHYLALPANGSWGRVVGLVVYLTMCE
jgi:hypothetical protein